MHKSKAFRSCMVGMMALLCSVLPLRQFLLAFKMKGTTAQLTALDMGLTAMTYLVHIASLIYFFNILIDYLNSHMGLNLPSVMSPDLADVALASITIGLSI